MDSMTIPIKERVVEVDRSDRNAIRQICRLMDLVYNDEWYETGDFISVPAWGRRFWFKRHRDVESIERVEEFRRC